MNELVIITHDDCLKHDPGPMHPESIGRLVSVMEAFRTCAFADRLDWLEAPLGTEEAILRAHTQDYLAYIRESDPSRHPHTQYARLDADTVMSRGSYQAALRAVGAGCAAVDHVLKGDARHAFCAIRPPGHHATPDTPMGFCIFNNIAIAAHHAMAMHGVERIAIVDFDVHHGNSTQEMFENDARVLYISTHQWPLWPGTGRAEERGVGNILNIPLPPRTAGEAYRKAFTEQAMPALHAHRPQLLMASAGFDAHADDPLAGLLLTEDDFNWIGAQLRAVAEEHCGGRVISFLEGGYDLRALAASAVSYLAAFTHNPVG